MSKDNLLETARNINIEKILAHYGHYKNGYGLYSCITHEDRHPSASVDTSRNKLHCFSCGNFFTTIDIVSIMENENNLRLCAKKVLEISDEKFEITKNNNTKSSNTVRTKGKKKLSMQDRKNMLDSNKKYIVENYLKSRSVDISVLKILEQNGYVYGADRYNQPVFIFEKYNCCIIRHAQRDINWVTGNNVPITITVDKSNKRWYITEGLYDAFSLVERGCNVICLNTVENVKNLKPLIINKKNFKYIIATDNDKAGLDAKDDLEKFFTENDMCYEIFEDLYKSEYKDINDMAKNGVLEM